MCNVSLDFLCMFTFKVAVTRGIGRFSGGCVCMGWGFLLVGSGLCGFFVGEMKNNVPKKEVPRFQP